MSQFLHRIEREMRQKHRTPAQMWTRRSILIILLTVTPLLVLESILRATGFSRPQVDPNTLSRTISASVEALNSRFGTDAFIEDPHLLWKLKPGSNLGGIDVGQDGLLNVVPANPLTLPQGATACKILCLGDSVTALTYRPYPSTSERLANAANLGRSLDIRNASVPGYSSEQALRWLERLDRTRPEIVLLCFGWNDQFSALNIPDRELGYSHAVTAMLHRLLGRMRIYQLIAAPVEARLLDRNSAGDEDGPTTGAQSRVSPRQFEENLDALVERARAIGARPVLMTQPENLNDASERNLEARSFVTADTPSAVHVHRQYNAIVRQVAIRTRTPLMDLEEEFLRRRRENFFEPDGIHLNGRGHNHVARLLLSLLRDEGKITAAEYDRIAAAERHDTTAPDKPRAAWSVVPSHRDTTTTETIEVGVVAHNVGNTRWLRKHIIPQFGTRTNVPYGGVSVTGKWRTINPPVRGIAVEERLPSDILPGETTSVTLTFAAPPAPGSYELEIGLRAERIGDLQQFGAETTTFTVTTK